MTALQIIAALLALVWLGSLTAVAACIVLDRRNDEAWEVERPEWADDECPLDSEGYPFPEASESIYEALCFEFWAKEMERP